MEQISAMDCVVGDGKSVSAPTTTSVMTIYIRALGAKHYVCVLTVMKNPTVSCGLSNLRFHSMAELVVDYPTQWNAMRCY